MKKVIFILLIILILASLFYSPDINDVKTLGPGCEGQNQRNNDGKKGYCFSSNSEGTTQQAIGDFPLTFVYEGAKTDGWTVEISSDKLSRIKTAYESTFLSELLSSTKNCKYYSFSYQRKPMTKTYNFPFVSEEDASSSDLCWIKELKPLCKACYYSIEPLWKDLENIQKLGGEPLSGSMLQTLATLINRAKGVTTFNSICNRNRGEGAEDYSICPDKVVCELDIPEGKTEIFGVSFENDNCGNKKVIPDNNGQVISLDEVEKRAKDFVDSCSVKYKQQTKCGNGKIEEREECDDGNKVDGDGCNKNCKKENPLCNGVIPPATQPAQIKGQANVDIQIEIDTHAILTKRYYNFGGKITSDTVLDKLVDGKLPKNMRYTIVAEGNAAVIRGVYSETMLKIAKEIPTLWKLLKNAEEKEIFRTGYVYEKENDQLTIKSIYSTDSFITDFVDTNKGILQTEYFIFNNVFEIEYSEGDGASIKISQLLLVEGKEKSSKSVIIQLDDTEARELIFGLLKSAELFEQAQKLPNNNQFSAWVPVADENDFVEKVKKNQANPGVKLKQRDGKNEIRKKLSHNNQLSNVVRYFNECIKKLKGDKITSAYGYDSYSYIYGDLA